MPTDKPVTIYDAPVSSTRTTEYINIDFSSDLTLDYESEAVLTTLLGRLASQKTETHLFRFAIDRQVPRESIATAEVAAGATGARVDITVEDPEYFVEGDVIEVPDDYNDDDHTNQLVIDEIDGSVLKCYPYDADYGVAFIAEGSVVFNLHSSMIEGSDGRSPQQTIPTVYEQVVNIFEDYFQLTNITEADRHYTGPERTRLREGKRKKHVIDHEYAYFFSRFVVDNRVSGKPRRQMSGLIEQIKTNILFYGGRLEDDDLFDFMVNVHNPAYTAGPKRMVLASGQLLADVNRMAKSSLRINSITRETTWGPNITEIQFAGKSWQFLEAPALSRRAPGWGVVIHPRYMRKRPLIPTVYKMNVHPNKANYIEDGYVSANAIEVRMEEVFGLIRPGDFVS